MLLLIDAHSGFPIITTTAMKKKTEKVDKPLTLVQCECMLEYDNLFRHHPGADARAHR